MSPENKDPQDWLNQWVGDGLDKRPVIIALCGPNGAGKSTFYESFLKPAGLRFLNPDVLAHELQVDAAVAAQMVTALRRQMLVGKESFVFETVFSDPAGDNLQFLKDAVASGCLVLMCFIGIGSAQKSEERVAMRVSQGGHDVPSEKLKTRFARTMGNLQSAIKELPHVMIFDNSDLREPFRPVARYEEGNVVVVNEPAPGWFSSITRKR